jgi:hypothetical protein
LGLEGGRPGRPTQAVGHTCSGNLGIVQILRYIRSDMYTAFFWQEDAPLVNEALCLSTPKHNGKSGTEVKDGRRARNKYKHTSTHIIYH